MISWIKQNCCYSFLNLTCWRLCVPLLNQVQECSSCLLENWQKRRRKKYFFEPSLSCFLLFLSSPFAAKSVMFLKLIRSLHINPSEFAFKKKTDSASVAIFLFQLRLWFWLGFVRYLTILAIFCHSWHVEELTYTFIGS